MRTAKAAILSVMALFAPGEALASASLLDHSISPAPDAIHSSLAPGLNAAPSADTAHAAATPKPGPETLDTAAKPKRGRGTYGMALAGLALLGFIARRRHRVLNATA